jgi:predicted protein tyrosine phosphatase
MPTATNICKNTAKDIFVLPNNTVLISINEEHGEVYPLTVDRLSSKVLTLRFSDVTSKHTVLDGTVHLPINEKQCLQVLDFINIHQGKDFIVHCAAGISRSSAICMYLHLFHGYELKPNFWELSFPNAYVLGKLIITRKKP